MTSVGVKHDNIYYAAPKELPVAVQSSWNVSHGDSPARRQQPAMVYHPCPSTLEFAATVVYPTPPKPTRLVNNQYHAATIEISGQKSKPFEEGGFD